MTKCTGCGKGLLREEVVEEYHESLLGIPVIVRGAVKRFSCEECGGEFFRTPNEKGLIAAVMTYRVLFPLQLSGTEARALRKAMGLTAREFAEKAEFTPEYLSKWENGKAAVGGHAEKIVRLLAGQALSEDAPLIDFQVNDILDMQIVARIEKETPVFVFERRAMLDKETRQDVDTWRIMDDAA